MKKYFVFLIITCMVLLVGCKSVPDNTADTSSQKTGSMDVKYATGFSVDYYDDHSHVTLGDGEFDVYEPYDDIYLASSSAM
nr:hypothetical protein [Lachnospiraceae bacterium]